MRQTRFAVGVTGVALTVLAALASVAGSPVGSTLGAQVVRGSVRDFATSLAVEGVTVTAIDTAGTVLAVAITGIGGRYALRVRVGGPYELRVRRLGFALQSIPVTGHVDSDTLEFEFLLREVAATAAAVTITAPASLNEQRLADAMRRGWRIYPPALVAQHRERAQDLGQLLHAISAVGLVIPRGRTDCILSMRSNRCLTIVLDGQVLGLAAMVIPSDIDFVAILSAADSQMAYGNRAPYGAIAVYTRSRLDGPPPRRPPG